MNTEIYANPNETYMLHNDKNEYDQDKIKEIIIVSDSSIFFTITHLIISLFAFYLSWRCNNGFNILSFLCALCCPYLYIIYALAVHGGCNNVISEIKTIPINKIN